MREMIRIDKIIWNRLPISLFTQQKMVLPRLRQPLTEILSGYPLTRWRNYFSEIEVSSVSMSEIFSRKANCRKNQCGQNLPTLRLTEKPMMWITITSMLLSLLATVWNRSVAHNLEYWDNLRRRYCLAVHWPDGGIISARSKCHR